jgi:Uma2 family endonuclease
VVKAVIADPWTVEQLLARRRKLGHDRWDEAWDGVWHMPPAPNLDHQSTVGDLFTILKEVIEGGGLGRVLLQVNVADPLRRMDDFRIPDLAVVLGEGGPRLEKVFVSGGPDFVVEVYSPGDETYEKLPWYASQGVREMLIVDRDSKAPALYRLHEGELRRVAASQGAVDSEVLPLRFERVEVGGAARLRVTHRAAAGRVWTV